ncbi:reverse transcriptase domain-containing protein [Tanacetum coccineum]
MLDKTNYSSWASRMLLYIKGKPNGKFLVDYVLNGPFQYGTIIEPKTETTPATVRARTYTDLTEEEKLRESVDITVTKIVLQGLPQDIYNLVNHNEDAKQIWDRVKLLIQGLELSLQERESKLYDDFDTFTSMHGETIYLYMTCVFAHCSIFRDDFYVYEIHCQDNTKFVSHLQPEWSKFVTNVKLAKAMHTTNFDHLYGHLRQHETHANKVRLARQRQGVAVQLRAVKCYNCQEEGHFARQCTKPKRPKNSAWFKEKMLLTEALEKYQPTAFQTYDLDAFDSNCDDVPSAKTGHKLFMTILDLESSDYLKDDSLTFCCMVGVVRPKKFTIIPLPPEMEKDFKYLLDSEIGSDIVFRVKDVTFKAHKAILDARSLVFKAQFYGLIGDPALDEVELMDIEPSVFKRNVEYPRALHLRINSTRYENDH